MTELLPIEWQPPEGVLRGRITAHLAEMAAMQPMTEKRLTDLRTSAVMEMRQFGWQTLAECVAEIDRLKAENGRLEERVEDLGYQMMGEDL